MSLLVSAALLHLHLILVGSKALLCRMQLHLNLKNLTVLIVL